MDPLLDPEYDKWRAKIDALRVEELAWETIAQRGAADAETALDEWLVAMARFDRYPTLGPSSDERTHVWNAIVAAKREWEAEAARHGQSPIVVGAEGTDRTVFVPAEARTTWQLYKKHLKENGWKDETLLSLENSTSRILRRLRFRTAQPEGAVKGLVVGHVQSGKTASMAALIAMAVDWRWNLVIVLTGTLENLRKQTEARLIGDLNHNGNLSIQQIEYPGPNVSAFRRSSACNFGDDSRTRYLVVSLKNKTRLENLRHWLNSDRAKLRQMRILLIDDEADQGSINTSPADVEERTRINGEIVRITEVGAEAMNYVAYTATPYANFLNEAYPRSLYPKHFIVALPQSDEHFGPSQVFGIDGTETEGGLGIVNDVSPKDLQLTKDAHSGVSHGLPEALKDAVCWFLCSTAAIRAWNLFVKPVSMLVHTSAQQAHHRNIAEGIESFLQTTDAAEIRERSEKVWREQTHKFTRTQFFARMPEYGRPSEVREYPDFKELAPHLSHLTARVSHIPMVVDDGGVVVPEYHDGIHLCIDNCANNGINNEGEHVRLRYPSREELLARSCSPAFIVVGGSTLSRGLTIENLVSTFFLRGGAQMDTLMQMGRWFGYRRGYELLPRIWMPHETRKKFAYMAAVETELRQELQRFMDGGRSPAEYGPRVLVHPTASWLRPTAKNRMREATGAKYDFSGVNRQLTIFHAGPNAGPKLRTNVEAADDFLAKLGSAEERTGAFVWRGVAFRNVAQFLRGQNYHPRATFFREIEPFIKWFETNADGFDDWNVVAAGNSVSREGSVWEIPGQQKPLWKIQRSRVVRAFDDDSLSIGVLRDPRHLIVDAQDPGQPSLPLNATNSEIDRARRDAKLESTPQLLIYRIDKDSRAKESSDRADLSVPADLIGVSIWLPSEDPSANKGRSSFATHLTVRIPADLAVTADDAVEEFLP